MNKNYIIIGVVIVAVVGVGIVLSRSSVPGFTENNDYGAGAPSNNEPVACTADAKQCPDGSFVSRVAPNCEFAECAKEAMIEPVVIVFTDTGYSPKSITIKKGTVVMYKNMSSSKDTWPAVAMHPSHTAYDGTTLAEHCANPTPTTFDACRRLKPGESWSVTLDKVGTWKYHDHVAASLFGEIIVTE